MYMYIMFFLFHVFLKNVAIVHCMCIRQIAGEYEHKIKFYRNHKWNKQQYHAILCFMIICLALQYQILKKPYTTIFPSIFILQFLFQLYMEKLFP